MPAKNGNGNGHGEAEEEQTDHPDDHEDEKVKDLALKLSMRMKGAHVEKSELMNYLTDTKTQQDHFMKLPFSLVFFTLFVMSVINREKLADSSSIQRELRSKVRFTGYEGNDWTSGHKELSDMRRKRDFYNFMRDGFLEVFTPELPVEPNEVNRILRYNQMIGGIQLQQVRRRRVPCSEEYPNLGPFPSNGRANPILADFGCYPWTTESDDCFGPWNSSARSDLPGGFCPDSKRSEEEEYGIRRRLVDTLLGRSHPARRLSYVPQGGGTGGSSKGARSVPTEDQLFSVYLYEHEGYDTAAGKIDQLEENNWIDFNTAWVGVSLLAFNPDLAVFVRVTLHLYFPPSGALLPHVTAESFAPEPYQDQTALLCDAAWAVMLVILMFQLFLKVFKAVKKEGIRSLLISVWTWLHVAMVLGGLGILMFYMLNMMGIETVKASAMKVRAARPMMGFVSVEYPRLVEQLHRDMADISGSLDAMRLYYSWYTILVSMSFLESFAAQPRLAVVTDTIYRAGTDLFHFMVVLLIVFLSYCIAGMFLFGRRLWEFSSMQYTISTCFRIMLGDDALWGDLGKEHPMTAGLWFWSYMILMTLVMLNMMMAIIMDVYTAVHGDAKGHAAIWTQVGQMCKERLDRMKGNRLSTLQLINRIHEIEAHDITKEVLLENVEGIGEDQADEILAEAQRRSDESLHKGITISKAMRIINWVKQAVEQMVKQLDEVWEVEKEERDLMKTNLDGDGGADRQAVEDDPGARNDTGVYAAEAENRLERIQERMEKLEEFMNQAMEYTNFRGKDLRNRLALIEDLIRGQRDASLASAERAVWDAPAPKLGGRRQSKEEVAAI